MSNITINPLVYVLSGIFGFLFNNWFLEKIMWKFIHTPYKVPSIPIEKITNKLLSTILIIPGIVFTFLYVLIMCTAGLITLGALFVAIPEIIYSSHPIRDILLILIADIVGVYLIQYSPVKGTRLR